MLKLAVWLCIAFPLASPVTISAQQPQIGSVSGVVADSLHGGPLVGAFVTVEGLGRSALTDSAGLFQIDSVAIGGRRLAVFHPLLDTLGVTLMTPPLEVVADSTVTVILAVPSVATVMRLKCGDASTGTVLGSVSRADEPDLPTGAAVVLRWTEVQIGRAIGVRNNRRELSVPVAPDGTFRFCGVPPGVAGEIFAVSPRDGAPVTQGAIADTSSAYQVIFEERPVLLIVGLVLPGSDVENVAPERTADAEAADQTDAAAEMTAAAEGPLVVLRKGRAVVSGVVVDSVGAPVAGARVWVQGAAGSATSDAAGRFMLREQPSGSGILAARKLVLAMTEQPVVISAHGRNEHTLRMTSTVVSLGEVVVRANRQLALERVGFYSRQQRRRGNLYLDAEQMEAMSNRASLANVLAAASNLTYRQGRIVGRYRPPRVTGMGGGNISLSGGYSCVAYLVDGQLWRTYTEHDAPTEYILPHEVVGIEVYRVGEAPRDLPYANYVRGCETVVIWTRHKLRVN